jgi:hypothetical protein
MSYTPENWYWIDDTGRLYSSLAESLVEEDNAAFQSWLESGNHPTPWPRDEAGDQTDTALLEVISSYGLVVAANPVDATRQKRIAALTRECSARIIGGFSSSALGAPHAYPSDIKDQINLMGSVTDSIMPGLPANWETPFWCRDAGGVWNWKMHDVAQIQQAGRDGKSHVVTCQTTLAMLTAQIAEADTIEAINIIGWPD